MALRTNFLALALRLLALALFKAKVKVTNILPNTVYLGIITLTVHWYTSVIGTAIAVMLTRTWDPRPRPRTQVTRSRPRPWGIKAKDKAKDFGPKAKAKAKDLGLKAKAKDLRCQSQ